MEEDAPTNDPVPHAVRSEIAIPLTRRAVIIFSLGATGIFSLLAWIITVYVRGQPFSTLFERGQQLTTQTAFGVSLGVMVAGLVLLILKAGFLGRLRNFIRQVLDQIRPTNFDLILVALLAGFGEELFFRAALQPLLGLWLTSLVFALAHTGVSLFEPAKLAFASFVFVMGLLLGVLYEQSGLVAAMIFHAVYDLIFLLAVKKLLRMSDA